MKTKDKQIVLDYLDSNFPNAITELEYEFDYQLLIAVVLSAQATDKAVNKVTRKLFSDFNSLDLLADLNLETYEEYFKEIGLGKTKAQFIKQIVDILIKKYNYRVPSKRKDLLEFPGVGNKTASLIRAILFNIPEIAVDTHVHRISVRLGLAKKTDKLPVVEKKLRRKLPKEKYITLHHQMILFGRSTCPARNPLCKNCPFVSFCHEENKNFKNIAHQLLEDNQ